MPVKNSTQEKTPDPNSHFPMWVIIFVVLAIAVIVVFFVFSQKPFNSNPTTVVNQPHSSDQTKKEIPDDVRVFSFVGEIAKLENDHLLLDAKAQKNYLPQDSILTVKFDQNTRFRSLNIPKVLTGNPVNDKLTAKIIKQEDLAVGQTVLVVSSEDLKNKQTFTATMVEIEIVR